MDFKFFDTLPESRGARGTKIDWAGAKEAMLKTPGMWCLIAENTATSTPTQVRSGSNRHFRGEELELFEFRVRKPEQPEFQYGRNKTDLYGRYTPETPDA